MSENNGNGDHSKFGIVAKEDPVLAIVVPQARRAVSKDFTLALGARLMFNFLTDLSLHPKRNVSRGIVRCSNKELAHTFGCTERAIQKWKGMLRSRGVIYTSEKWMQNSWPHTTYHIVAIVGAQPELSHLDLEEGYLPDDDAVRRSNRRRMTPRERYQGETIRDKDGKAVLKKGAWLPYKENLSQVSDADDVKRSSVRATHEPPFVPRTNHDSCDDGTIVRAPHEPSFVPATNGKTLDARTTVRAPHEPSFVPRTNVASVKEETGDVSRSLPEIPFKRSTGLNALRAGGGARKDSPENQFLFHEVGPVMDAWKPGRAKFELKNSGAWWRLALRADHNLARRVLAEVNVMVKESRIITNPGAAAVDLWKRWDGPELSAEKYPSRKAVGK